MVLSVGFAHGPLGGGFEKRLDNWNQPGRASRHRTAISRMDHLTGEAKIRNTTVWSNWSDQISTQKIKVETLKNNCEIEIDQGRQCRGIEEIIAVETIEVILGFIDYFTRKWQPGPGAWPSSACPRRRIPAFLPMVIKLGCVCVIAGRKLPTVSWQRMRS